MSGLPYRLDELNDSARITRRGNEPWPIRFVRCRHLCLDPENGLCCACQGNDKDKDECCEICLLTASKPL